MLFSQKNSLLKASKILILGNKQKKYAKKRINRIISDELTKIEKDYYFTYQFDEYFSSFKLALIKLR